MLHDAVGHDDQLERMRSYGRKYDATHREGRRQKARERWRRLAAVDPDGVKEKRRQQYEMSGEHSRELSRVWKRDHLDRARQTRIKWADRNPGILNAYHSRRRARKIGNGGSHTYAEWLEKCDLLGNVCFYCGEDRLLVRDHNMPLVRGGTDDITNIVPACRSCNARKHAKTAQEFIAQRMSA